MNRRSALTLAAAGSLIGAAGNSRVIAQQPLDSFPNGFRWIHEFASRGAGAGNDTSMFQRGIDYIRGIAMRSRDTSHLPALLMASGRYALTAPVETAPWVKLCSVGGVLLDFAELPVGLDGITCRNETTLAPTNLRYPGDRSPFLDGTGGTISILGPGIDRAEGWGVVMGNREAGFSGSVRDAGGRNVVVTGWRGALRIDPINTFLATWFSSRFEQNRDEGIYVASTGGRSVNSGERMTFVDCTFAGSSRALHIDSDSMDFIFDACSFDFNGDVVYFGRQARFGTVAFNHCHIEGIDGLLVNATNSGKHLRTVFRDSIVLPRHWKRKELSNAPRQLVAGSAKFSASGVEWRLESSEQGTLTALIGDEVPVESLNAMSFQKVQALLWRGGVINADSLFSLDIPGTPVSALTHWSISSAGLATGEIVVVNATAKNASIAKTQQALQLTLPDRDNTSFSLTTRAPFPVSPGDTVMAACTAMATRVRGGTTFTFQFHGIGGVPLGISESQRMPNELPSAQAVVPPGASQAALKVTFTGWTGKFEINELAVWRLS